MTILVTKKPLIVPQALLKQAGINPGDLLEFTAKPGRITIRKVKSAA